MKHEMYSDDSSHNEKKDTDIGGMLYSGKTI